VLLILLAVIAGVVILRSAPGSGQEEADEEAPIVAPSRVAEVDGDPLVVLDSAEVRRIGLTTTELTSAAAQGGRRLAGQVIPEPERTVTVRAPVAGRLTAAQGGRWPSLGERLQAGAPLGRVSDAQPLSVPIAGVVTAVGARPGEIVEAGQMLLELADNSHPVEARLVGPAPEADPLTRQPAYLYRSRARWTGAVPGTAVPASVPDGAKVEGVLVPDAAVVQWEGLAWVYVVRGPGQYIRARVSTDYPAPGGWVTGRPLAPGDSVVVAGVQELLSEEFRARVTVGEESGE
jgi:biotin carboxyl carrier protein